MSDPRATAGSIQVTKATEVKTGHGQTEGMDRQSAIVDKSHSLCGLLMRAKPHGSSDIHHHGGQDTIIYAVSGVGAVASQDDQGNEVKTVLHPGDWALIPAYREHKEVNENDEELVWVIVRAPGGAPETVNLTGWKGEEQK